MPVALTRSVIFSLHPVVSSGPSRAVVQCFHETGLKPVVVLAWRAFSPMRVVTRTL